MSADWEEVKRLAADFQRAQLSSTIQRLSERNCIEIVKKLIELKLIDVIFTNDGKEYLTPARLLKEIKDELIVHGGRINLVDLAQIIGVDYNHVEAKAGEFASSEPGVRFILGQLITSDYLDHLAEEINEKLNQVGEINIAELTKLYDLPGDFLEQAIHERLGTIIQGQVESSDSRTIFTESYLVQHAAKIRGALSALTRPIPLPSLISHFKFPEKYFYQVAESLIKEGRLSGSISGGRSERAIFIPDLYAKSQNEWIDSFYKQNGYLEYDAIIRLGIQDPKSYIRKKFKEEHLTYLNSCCVGKNILSQIEGTIEEALNCGAWVDIIPALPSVFSDDDCRDIITAVTKCMSKLGSVIHVYCDTVVVSDEFIKSCFSSFEPLMTSKAQEDIVKKPHLFVAPQQNKNVLAKKETVSRGKQDRKEEKKRKAPTAGKSGGGTQGRETKVKAVKKKYHTGKELEDSGSEEETSISSDSKLDLQFLSVSEIEHHLIGLKLFQESPEDFVSELALEMHKPLTKRYQEVAKALYQSASASSGTTRRKQHADYQEKFSTLLNHINMFEKGAKLFSEDIINQLFKHLLRTLCTDLVNMIVSYIAQESGVTSSDAETALTTESRQKLISKFPDELRQPFMKLHGSLNEKNLDDFNSSIQVVLGPGLCDMVLRKLDKKKERLLLSNHRQSLLSQLNDASDPALCLHLAVLVIFQSHNHNMLHASGKFVPHIITFLQKQVPLDMYQFLIGFQELVIKKLTPSEEDKDDGEASLCESIPKIKEIAVTYRKTSISESEN